jgi:hypothetical protein
MLTVIPSDGSGRESWKGASPSPIDEIVREGDRRMLAEADAYIARFAGERDDNSRRLVVRNGYHQPRAVLTSATAVEVTVPRVNDKRTDPATGERRRFSSEPAAFVAVRSAPRLRSSLLQVDRSAERAAPAAPSYAVARCSHLYGIECLYGPAGRTLAGSRLP